MLVPLLLATLGAAPGNEVVARVDGVAITVGAVTRRLEAPSQGLPLQVDEALQQLVNEAVLAAEGRRMGLGSSPEVTAAIERGTRGAAATAFIEDVGSRAEITESRLRTSFHLTADFASFDALYFASRAEADASRRRIRDGSSFAKEAPRAAVARVNPKPDEAPPSMRGELDPALGVLFDAAPGEIVGPVETATGWVLARLIRKEIGAESQFAARRAALLRSARNQIKSEMRQHLAAQLRAKAGVQVDEPFLRAVPAASATPQQLDHVIATVNGRPIRYRDIQPSVIAISSSIGGHSAGTGVSVSVAWQAVEARLIEEAAVERGFTRSPAVKAVRPEIERWALATAAAARIESSAPAPTDREIEAFYERNRAAFKKPFAEVLPAAAAGAAAEKRRSALAARVQALRNAASISADAAVLQKAAGAQP